MRQRDRGLKAQKRWRKLIDKFMDFKGMFDI